VTPKGEDPVDAVAGVIGVKTPELALIDGVHGNRVVGLVHHIRKPVGSIYGHRARTPAATVGGVVGVNTPVLALMANMETVLSSLFAVLTNLPDGSIVIPWGKYPVGTAAGVVGARTPVLELQQCWLPHDTRARLVISFSLY